MHFLTFHLYQYFLYFHHLLNNYYQLAITNNTNINARVEATTTAKSPYTYKYKGTPVIILEMVEGQEISGSKIWYKVQSDANLNSSRTEIVTTSWATYNWNSYVYIHSSFLTLINDSKNEDDSYNNPNNLLKEPTNSCVYKTYADNLSYTPLIGIINENKDYFGGHQIYLTTHNFGGVRVAVSKGDMTYSQLVSTCPFDNNLYIEKCSASNIEYINNQSAYYAIYTPSSIIYDNGYTYAATISYIAENEKYGQYLHVEATEYQITAKQILIEFLRNNINPNL